MKIPNNILKAATGIAITSDVKRSKIGAVLFTNKGRLITSACNRRLMGRQKKRVFTLHAEQFLLAKIARLCAHKRFKDLNILIARVMNGTGKLGIAKPCDKCYPLLKELGFPVYYTTGEDIEEIRFN